MNVVRIGTILLAACVCSASASCFSGQEKPAASGGGAVAVQSLIAEGGSHLSAGRFEEAAARFRTALERQPDASDALFGLGIACSQMGRLQEARKALERYVELEPKSAEGHAVLGMVLLAEGRRAEARPRLERALTLNSDHFEAARALSHLEIGDFNGARAAKLLEPFAESAEFDGDARLTLAGAFLQSGKDKEALALLLPWFGKQPAAPPQAFVLAAGAAQRSGDGKLAARICAAGLREHLNSDEVEERCLGIVTMPEFAPYFNSVEASLRGTPEDVPALIFLGRLMTDVAVNSDVAPERGTELLQKAVALNGSDASALYNLGRCLRVQARAEEAIALFEKALAAGPGDEVRMLIYTQFGLASEHLQRREAADKAFRQALDLNRRLPRRLPEPAFRYYTFLRTMNRDGEAGALLEEILGWNAAFLPARMQRARAQSEAGRLEAAVSEAELVVRNADPANLPLLRSAHILLLQLYNKLGRPEDAARHQAWLRAASAKQK